MANLLAQEVFRLVPAYGYEAIGEVWRSPSTERQTGGRIRACGGGYRDPWKLGRARSASMPSVGRSHPRFPDQNAPGCASYAAGHRRVRRASLVVVPSSSDLRRLFQRRTRAASHTSSASRSGSWRTPDSALSERRSASRNLTPSLSISSRSTLTGDAPSAL
jgi:hypothetical protein